METALRRMAEMLDASAQAVSAWFAETEGLSLSDPGAWPLGLWLLVAAFVLLLLALFLRRRARPTLEVRPPEILITQGELVPGERTGRLGAGTLTMTVSNLGRYPVQVLESASRTGPRGRVGVAETVHLVPALSEVELRVQLPVGKLDDGLLDVYCYAAATRNKLWRHQAELTWEPWAKRFKVAPLEQRVEPARSLASERRDVVRIDDVAKAEHAAARHAAATARHVEAGARRDAEARRAVREASGRRPLMVGVGRASPAPAPDGAAPARDETGPAPDEAALDEVAPAPDEAALDEVAPEEVAPAPQHASASKAASLAALVRARPTPPIVPPRESPGNPAGAAARASRVPARSSPSVQARAGPSAGPGYGLQRSGVQPSPARESAASAATDTDLPSTPSSDAPLPPRDAEVGPRARTSALPAGPAALRRASSRAADPEDPDAPPRPTRPRDRRLEFPEDF